jgi:hypothetical protein
MRAILTAALLVLAMNSPASAADLEIVRVWPGYRTAESFERISEYFTGKENTSGESVHRTQADSRAGYYFLVRMENRGSEIASAHAELHVITPASAEPKTYSFPCTVQAGSNVLHLGLTGTDWPEDVKDETVAWRLRLLKADGTELADSQSFLWANPAKK